MSVFASLLLNRYVLSALGIALAGYFAYDWAYDRGQAAAKAHWEPKYTKVVDERDELKQTLAAALATQKSQEEAHERALALQKAEAEALLASIKSKLDKSQKVQAFYKERIDALTTTLVTSKADAACTVPLGFVSLHNLALEALPSTSSPAPSTSLSSSGLQNVDAPSGVALSEVGRTVSENYSECSARLEVIESWQQWYSTSMATWKAAVEQQGKFKIFTP